MLTIANGYQKFTGITKQNQSEVKTPAFRGIEAPDSFKKNGQVSFGDLFGHISEEESKNALIEITMEKPEKENLNRLTERGFVRDVTDKYLDSYNDKPNGFFKIPGTKSFNQYGKLLGHLLSDNNPSKKKATEDCVTACKVYLNSYSTKPEKVQKSLVDNLELAVRTINDHGGNDVANLEFLVNIANSKESPTQLRVEVIKSITSMLQFPTVYHTDELPEDQFKEILKKSIECFKELREGPSIKSKRFSDTLECLGFIPEGFPQWEREKMAPPEVRLACYEALEALDVIQFKPV